MTAAAPIFDPADPAFRVDPYPMFARLRAENPVHWSPPLRAWVVTRHDDVRTIMRHDAMSADRITPFYRALSPDGRSQVEVLVRVLGRWLVFRDPPDHTRLRALIARAFTPKELATIRPNVEAITALLLQRMRGHDAIDLVAAFANPLPAYVIMDMLGVPRDRLDEMKSWSDDIKLFIGTSQSTSDKYARARRGVEGMAAMFRELIADHRARPRADVLMTLIEANEDGSGRLDDEELVATAILFLFAGHETTASLIAMATRALTSAPDVRLGFLALKEPRAIQLAIEEFLRFDGPTPAMIRVALTAHEIGGHRIADGDRVVTLIGSANRDEAVFEAADVLQLSRDPNPHVTFGYGSHFCLGAPLARLEAQIALPALHRQFPAMVPAGAVTWADGLTLRGPTTMPVRLQG
jgi:hypothetical protein